MSKLTDAVKRNREVISFGMMIVGIGLMGTVLVANTLQVGDLENRVKKLENPNVKAD